jgi:hypothetical protein
MAMGYRRLIVIELASVEVPCGAAGWILFSEIFRAGKVGTAKMCLSRVPANITFG